MLKVYYGNLKDIKEQVQLGEYIKDIKAYLNRSTSLFGNTSTQNKYFIYNSKEICEKEDILCFIKKATADKNIVSCIIESIDKKSIFYKSIKDIMIEIKSHNVNDLDMFYKDNSYIRNINPSNIISFLYALYFNFKKPQYKKAAGSTINMVLTGKLNTLNAAQVFLLLL